MHSKHRYLNDYHRYKDYIFGLIFLNLNESITYFVLHTSINKSIKPPVSNLRYFVR